MITFLLRVIALLCGLAIATVANAFFFIVPIPNLSKPPALNRIIDALEKSEDTKAVAFVSEDKSFGSKFWAWGQFSGHVTQAEADRVALSRCQQALSNAKAQQVGGKPLYDFGSKVCELYTFTNQTVSPRAGELQNPTAAPAATPGPSAPAVTAPALPQIQAPQATLPTPAPPVPTASPPPEPTQTTSAPTPVAPSVIVPVPQSQSDATRSPSAETPTTRRLMELNDLLKNGLITKPEYEEKRKAILMAM